MALYLGYTSTSMESVEAPTENFNKSHLVTIPQITLHMYNHSFPECLRYESEKFLRAA